MFNPKSTNLLDEQLAVSGLEMNWVFAAVGAAASIAGGIMGMNQAKSNNSKAKKNAKKQKAFNKKVVKLITMQCVTLTIKLRCKTGSVVKKFTTMNLTLQ